MITRRHAAQKVWANVQALAVVFISSAMILGTPAHAQSTYPTKTIKMIVPFGAGGPTDVVARLVGEKLSQVWGQQVIIENMAGGGGNTGTAAAAKAAPDGYTFLAVSTGFIVNPSLYARVPYNLKTSFEPVSLFAKSPNIVSVHPSVPATTMKELIDLIKANPGKYSYAQPATGSTPHLAGELLKLQYGLDLATVSHNSAAAAITNTLGGHTPIAITVLPAAQSNIQAGKLRGIAVMSATRVPGLPDVPTTMEAGIPDQESDTLTGFVAPSGTPRDIVLRFQSELVKMVADPAIRKQLIDLGFEPVASTPEAFAQRIESESAKWGKIITDAKIRVE